MPTANAIVEGLVSRGVPRTAAFGLAGNAFVESKFDPSVSEIDPAVEGSRGGFSLFQWTGPRRRQYENFAGSQGLDPANLDTALDFTAWELANTEKAAADRIYAAATPEEAAKAASEAYLRPGTPHLDRRIDAATRIAAGENIEGSYSDARPSIAAPSVETVTQDPDMIERAYQAFINGNLSEEAAESYRADVATGRMPIPEGGVIGERRNLSEETLAEVFRRYQSGEFTDQQRAEYEADVRLGVMPLPSAAPPQVLSELSQASFIPSTDDTPSPERGPRKMRGELSGELFETARRAAGGLVGGAGVVDIPAQMPLMAEGGAQISFPEPVQAVGEYLGDLMVAGGSAGAGAWTFAGETVADALVKSGVMSPNDAQRFARDWASMPEAFAGSAQTVLRGPRARGRPSAAPDETSLPTRAPDAAAREVIETGGAEEIGSLVRRAAGGSDRALEELARVAKIDPEAAAAAERLGIDLPPDILSNHQMVREAAGLTRSIAGTPASAAWRETLLNAVDSADVAIRQLGGSPDLSTISDDILRGLQGTQAALKAESDGLFKSIDAAVPKAAIFEPNNIVKRLNEAITDMGGIEGLTKAERSLFDMVTGDRPVTYARLMREKQEIGKALRNADSAYSNSDQYVLKRLYGALSKDQVANVDRIGGRELRDNLILANGLTAKRKALEERIVSAFGKDLEGSVAGTLRNAITSAAKGDLTKFNRVMEVIPKELQREAVASAVTAATRSARATEPGFGFAEYSKFYGNLRANQAAYSKVAGALGPEGHRIMRDLYDISRRVTDARANVLTTGKANQAIVNSMLAEGLVGRMLNSTIGRRATQATATGAGAMTGGPVGAMLGAAFTDVLALGKKDRMGAAGNVFTSDQFRKLAEEAATTGRVSDATMDGVASSPSFRKWADMVGITDPRNWISSAILGSIAGPQTEDEQ